jgi:hypothetical protein
LDLRLDRGVGEVAGVGQVRVEFGFDDGETVDPLVAQHGLVVFVRPDRAVWWQRRVDPLDQPQHPIDLVEEFFVELDPAGVLQLDHPVDDVG